MERTKAQYRKTYDADLAKDVRDKTGSDYGRMMAYALAAPDAYVADIIHAACHGVGCDEEALIELCMTRSPKQLAAGKKCWEGRRGKGLFDWPEVYGASPEARGAAGASAGRRHAGATAGIGLAAGI